MMMAMACGREWNATIYCYFRYICFLQVYLLIVFVTFELSKLARDLWIARMSNIFIGCVERIYVLTIAYADFSYSFFTF